MKRSLPLLLLALAIGCDRPQPKPPAAPPPRAAQSAPRDAQASPPGAPAQAAAAPAAPAPDWPTSTAASDPEHIEVGGLRFPRPPTWTWQQPTMAFRTLQYSVPATAPGQSAAELVLSLFRGDDGGPLDANISRWAGQFRTPEGAAATPKIEVRQAGGMTVHLIELAGAYQGMGAASARPDQMQLSAIIEAPGRRVFVRLVGPTATVQAQRAAFEGMITGLERTAD